MQAEEQITSCRKFFFFFVATSLKTGDKLSGRKSVVSPREKTTLERESARAFYITLYIFVEKRERQRIKSDDDDDDDDDDASSSSRPRSRSLFLLVGEY